MTPLYKEEFETGFLSGPLVGVALVIGAAGGALLLQGPIDLLGPVWALPPIIALVLVLAWNFRRMGVIVDPTGVHVGFRLRKRRLVWTDIDSYVRVKGPEPRRGDLGYHVNRVRGLWRVSYIGPVSERVLFRRRSGFLREVFISVGQPERFLEGVDRQIGERRQEDYEGEADGEVVF